MSRKKDKTSPLIQELTISSDLDNLKKVEKFSQKICEEIGLSQEQSDNMAIALTELAINAIVHGNDRDKNKKVTFRASINDDHLRVFVQDQGDGFSPEKLPNPTNPQNIWKEHGRGIFLVQNLIDEVDFQRTPEGMKIILTEYLENNSNN